MNDEHLIDRMPEIAHGRGSWTGSEAAHLAGCRECREEWQIVARVARGGITELRSPLDLGALQAAVSGRLAEPVVITAVRPPLRRWAWGVAAAAMLLLGVGGSFVQWNRSRSMADTAMVPVRSPTLLPELDRLLESELEMLLAMMEPSVDDLRPGAAPLLGELTDSELELLLGEIEG